MEAPGYQNSGYLHQLGLRILHREPKSDDLLWLLYYEIKKWMQDDWEDFPQHILDGIAEVDESFRVESRKV